MRILKALLVTIIIGCAGYLGVSLYQASLSSNEINEVANIVKENAEREDEENPSGQSVTNLHKEFNIYAFKALKGENPDFVGYLFWNDDYALPVVQTNNNGDYLRTSFYKRYSSQGTPYMDSVNTLSDDNITIYGHNVFYDKNAMFSPVASMVSQKNFDKYSHFYMYREDGIHEYNAKYVYYLTQEEHETHYAAKPNFENQEAFEEWIHFAENRTLVKSNVKKPVYGDQLITLYTCKEWDEETRIVVHAFEISFTPW